MDRKYQVFISSTFNDLKAERMEAILSILDSENIPVCMELFKSGNTSQWDTIKKWINESDIFMLILGGRYGTVENNNKKRVNCKIKLDT